MLILGSSAISTEKQTRINEAIAVPEVRLVIDATGEQVGVVSISEALRRAEELNLDLVEISPNANPPVCKVMDFGKFKYHEQKKAHAAKQNQKQVHVKEIKLRPVTDDHDYEIKLRNAKRFLEDGDKVKFIVQFRGREMAHQELGLRYLERAQQDLLDLVVVEMVPKVEGRNAIMIVAPKKKK